VEAVGQLPVHRNVLEHRRRAWRIGLSRHYQAPSLLQQLQGSDSPNDESSNGGKHSGKPRTGEGAQHFQGTDCFDENGKGNLIRKQGHGVAEHTQIQSVESRGSEI